MVPAKLYDVRTTAVLKMVVEIVKIK